MPMLEKMMNSKEIEFANEEAEFMKVHEERQINKQTLMKLIKEGEDTTKLTVDFDRYFDRKTQNFDQN